MGGWLEWKRCRPPSDSLLIRVDHSGTAVAKPNSLALSNVEFRAGDYRSFDPGRQVALAVFNESFYYIGAFFDAIAKAESYLPESGVVIVSMSNTLVTRHIWKNLLERRKLVQSLSVNDHSSNRAWRIRVFPGSGAGRT
jgi:trans-aconitate methyltransferase